MTLSPRGEFLHIRCRTLELELSAMDSVARAQEVREGAARLIEDTERRLAPLLRELRDRAAENIRRARELKEARRSLQASIPAYSQEPMTRTPQARRSRGRLFLLAGEVTSWHPSTRVLTTDEHVFVLSIVASPDPVAVGRRVFAKGYQHRSTGQRIVTQLRRA